EVPMVRSRAVLTALVVSTVVHPPLIDGTSRAQEIRPPAERTRARDLPEALPGRNNGEKQRDGPLPVPVSPPTILRPEVHPTVPGVFPVGNTASGAFSFLESRQLVRQREFENIAVRNQVFLQVTLAFSELLRAEARHAVALQARDEARVIARLTADYAQVGQG